MIKQREDFLTLFSSWKQAATLLFTKASSSLVVMFIVGSFIEFFLVRLKHGFETSVYTISDILSYFMSFMGCMTMDAILLLFVAQLFSSNNKSIKEYCNDNASTLIINFVKIFVLNTVKYCFIGIIVFPLYTFSQLLCVIVSTTLFAAFSLAEYLAIFDKFRFLGNFRESLEITSNFLATLVIFVIIFYCYPITAIGKLSIPVVFPLLKTHLLFIHRKHRLSRTALQKGDNTASTKTKSE